MKASVLIGLYPGAWRRRYGDEMAALIEDRPAGFRGSVDLVRGALDVWLHPTMPSRVPIASALAGGGLWTVVAAGVVLQPVPLDWPGYLAETLPMAFLAVGFLLVATLGCALRITESRGRAIGVVTALAGLGYLAWIAALGAALAGVADGPTMAAAQTLALVGTALVGVILVHSGDEMIGLTLLAGASAMIIPLAVTWLTFGAAWTAVGLALAVDRTEISRPRWRRT
jgi:hypothetical protein